MKKEKTFENLLAFQEGVSYNINHSKWQSFLYRARFNRLGVEDRKGHKEYTKDTKGFCKFG